MLEAVLALAVSASAIIFALYSRHVAKTIAESEQFEATLRAYNRLAERQNSGGKCKYCQTKTTNRTTCPQCGAPID